MPEDNGTQAVPTSEDDLRGKTPEELNRLVKVLDAHIRSLHMSDEGELRILTEPERRAFELTLELRRKAMKMLEEHDEIITTLRERPKAVQDVYTAIKYGLEDTGRSPARLLPAEARDKALRVLDDRTASAHLKGDQKDQIEQYVRRDADVARRVVVTENEDYRNAWMKLVTNPAASNTLSDDERKAMQAWEEYRAMSESSAAGGYGQEEAA